MLKKTIAGLFVAVVLALPFVTKAQNAPSDQTMQALNALSKEQLIKVVLCLNQRGVGQGNPNNLEKCIVSVTPKPTISVLTPNGGEVITNGTPFNIKWQSNISSSSPINIYLEASNLKTQTLIATGVPNTGYYSWIPKINAPSTSTAYKIWLKTSSFGQSAYDTSDSPFWIINPPATTSQAVGEVQAVLSPVPSNNQIYIATGSVPVYGLDVTAKNAKMSVVTIDLRVKSQIASSSPNAGIAENPGVAISNIELFADESFVTSLPVNQSTFAKNTSGEYYTRLAGLQIPIAKDQTRRLFVKFTGNPIDTDRLITVGGGTTSMLRSVSDSGISTFTSFNGVNFEKTHTFKGLR